MDKLRFERDVEGSSTWYVWRFGDSDMAFTLTIKGDRFHIKGAVKADEVHEIGEFIARQAQHPNERQRAQYVL